MRYNLAGLIIATLGIGLFFVPQSAEAGKVCSRLGLANNCVGTSDLQEQVNFGRNGVKGQLRLLDKTVKEGVKINGQSGDFTNKLTGNGTVKAWAKIRWDGVIVDCWRCNRDPAQTFRIVNGYYKVDFTPLSTDISNRPRSAINDVHTGFGLINGNVTTITDISDASSVRLYTFNGSTTVSFDFTLFI